MSDISIRAVTLTEESCRPVPAPLGPVPNRQTRPLDLAGEQLAAALRGETLTLRLPVSLRTGEFGSAPASFWDHGDFARAWVDGKGGDKHYLKVPCHDVGTPETRCAHCREWGWEETVHRFWPLWWPHHEWLGLDADDKRPPHRFWVREDSIPWERGHVQYRADYAEPMAAELAEHGDPGWRPAAQMPRWASRLSLEIRRVHLDRRESGGWDWVLTLEPLHFETEGR